ncbi:MAG: GtrA family protein [Pseudomonadota bacterium]
MTIPEREKLAQFLRFGIVGGLTALIYAVGFLLLNGAGVSTTLAVCLAYGAAIVFQYFGHAGFTFRKTARDGGQVQRFLVLNGVGLLLAIGITLVMTGVMGLPDVMATVTVVVALPIMNWIIMRLWVFA